MSDDVLPFPAEPRVPPRLLAAVEAILFVSAVPVRFDQLREALQHAHPDDIRAALEILATRTAGEERGVELVEVGGAWQFRTDSRFAEIVAAHLALKPTRLSRAALECLSVIAYEQPATKGDVDKVRGVDCGGTVRNLLTRGLIRVAGRRQVPGRPLQYRTTRAFLELFELPDLDSLPTLSEGEELSQHPRLQPSLLEPLPEPGFEE